MNKILNYLGLAKRAGKIIIGTDGVIDKLRHQLVNLMFVANDASLATIDKVEKKGLFYKTRVIKNFSTEELSHALGTNNSKVIGIMDLGFTKAILAEIERGD